MRYLYLDNNLKALFVLIILSFISLFSQTDWSNPVQVSGTYWCRDAAITVDSTGTISAIWCKNTDLGGNYYGSVYFNQSFNGGDNWTGEVNITPYYSTDPLWELRLESDTKGSLHAFYAKSLAIDTLVYKRYDGNNWSRDYTINFGLSNNMRYGIDNNDKLYAMWSAGSSSYYTHYDTNNDSVSWSYPKRIHPTIDYVIMDFTFNSENDIHSTGFVGPASDYRPYYSFFDSSLNSWSTIEEMGEYQEKTLGCAIALTNKDSLYVNTSIGTYSNENTDNVLSKDVNDSIWSVPVETGAFNNRWGVRKMFVDEKNIVHIFEINEEYSIYSLNHTYGNQNLWQTETIHSDPDFGIAWFDVVRKEFDGYDEYYVLYCKGQNIEGIPSGMINFQKRQFSTGIQNNEQFTIDNYTLAQNYPNPFNNSTTISYQVKEFSDIKLDVFNAKGEFVKTLVNGRKKKGKYSVVFNANDLNSGVYYYQLSVDGVRQGTKKMLYLR